MRRISIYIGIAVLVLGILLMIITSQNRDRFFALLPSEVDQNASMQFIIAGIPAWYDIEKEATDIFAEVTKNGIDGFFPTFQYQEVPKPKSTGQEQLFLDKCTSPQEMHVAMEHSGLGMVVPLELLYGTTGRLPSIEDDPLSAYINCIGRENILAVASADEPVHNGVSEAFVASLYNRVKTIDATLPVLMVHAPVTADVDKEMNERQRQEYLLEVINYSQYADVVGFDIYALPFIVAKMTTPYADGKEVPYDQAIEEYITWMEENLSDKQHLMVFQAFSFADQYSDIYIETHFPAEILEVIKAPSLKELQRMIDIAKAHELEYVIWWGLSFVKDTPQLWQDVLSVTNTAE